MGALPRFLILGAQKAGTSTLYEALRGHPDVQTARDPETGRAKKEVHFFDNFWHEGSSWYASHYESGGVRGLDATPNYLSDLRAHARMAQVVPEARLVVSLRDPIERAYSQYNHYVQDRPRSREWDWLCPDGDLDANVRAELELGSPLEPRYRGLVGRGYYIEQIVSLLRHYPREQMHVMVMERWTREPRCALEELMGFLRLRHAELPLKLAHRRSYTVEPMMPATRGLLAREYESYNSRLFDFLGGAVDEWTRAAV